MDPHHEAEYEERVMERLILLHRAHYDVPHDVLDDELVPNLPPLGLIIDAADADEGELSVHQIGDIAALSLSFFGHQDTVVTLYTLDDWSDALDDLTKLIKSGCRLLEPSYREDSQELWALATAFNDVVRNRSDAYKTSVNELKAWVGTEIYVHTARRWFPHVTRPHNERWTQGMEIDVLHLAILMAMLAEKHKISLTMGKVVQVNQDVPAFVVECKEFYVGIDEDEEGTTNWLWIFEGGAPSIDDEPRTYPVIHTPQTHPPEACNSNWTMQRRRGLQAQK